MQDGGPGGLGTLTGPGKWPGWWNVRWDSLRVGHRVRYYVGPPEDGQQKETYELQVGEFFGGEGGGGCIVTSAIVGCRWWWSQSAKYKKVQKNTYVLRGLQAAFKQHKTAYLMPI